MKKILLTTMVLASLTACKKETKTENTGLENQDSLDISEISEPEISSAKFAVFSPQQATDFLKKQNNDTIYVTNFFATWCRPCVHEIPYFKEKMTEMKDQPVKFTFISIDEKVDWETEVRDFSAKHGISENTVLMDMQLLTPDFFTTNFKTWTGEYIPFTIIRKGDKTEEISGGISKEELAEKIKSVL
ncbi:MAG: TlpA family protein disulfide reductase [Flavobacteriaceae bacterium]|jgi:thiol-disulfide isomerase/thioredoxin|nr:TlpA family protein disulfide reductase [Flavobacteriaceae bacterium]